MEKRYLAMKSVVLGIVWLSRKGSLMGKRAKTLRAATSNISQSFQFLHFSYVLASSLSSSQQSVTTVPYAKPTLQSKLFALGRRRTIGEYRGRRTDAFDRDTQKMETDTEVGLRGYKDEDGGGNQEESGMMMTNVEKNRG